MCASVDSPGTAVSARSCAGWLIAVAIGLLPLACWPGLARPFSSPKLWLVAALDLLVVFRYLTRVRSGWTLPPWPWLLWIAAISLSAVTGVYLSTDAFLLLVLPLPLALAGTDPTRALCIGSAVESAIVILQFANLDPFSWFGWHPETTFTSPRMRVYGTLGNPDFVAAWLAATLPLIVLVRSRRPRLALAVLQLAALFCTGSRVSLFAMPGAIAAATYTRRFDRWWLIAVPLMSAIVWFSPARPLATTLEGRLHLAKVTAVHVREVPLTGHGPGSFETMFARWRPDERPVDHAHNDYLEFWVEYGPLGLGGFLVLCGWLFLRPGRGPAPPATISLATLVAIACVDFPFHRPAEWALFMLLAGVSKEVRDVEPVEGDRVACGGSTPGTVRGPRRDPPVPGA